MATDNMSKSVGRSLTFRLLAVLFALSPFIICELTLRSLRMGEATEAAYPTIGFEAIHPLFVRNDTGDRYETAKSRQAYFYPDSFAAEKPPNEFRIFCLGGSTVQGRPYSIETSFTTWLELGLNAADPARLWEVVNCGGVSYASYRLVPILEEVLKYQPDLIVVYTGHNEFLEARSYGNQPKANWLSKVRTLNVIRSAVQGESRLEGTGQPSEILAAEVDALLDYRGGLADYHRDDSATQAVVGQYAQNLQKMVALADAANVPLVLLNPASNLKDTPPFKIEASDGVPSKDLAKFEAWVAESRSADSNTKRIELLEQAVGIDPRHAGARFLLGHAYLAQNLTSDAHSQFVAAKDEDVCPLRMIELLHEALANVANESKTPLIDVRAQIESLAVDGIPGDLQFLDHIHPTIDSHQVIAKMLISHLIDNSTCDARAGWETERDTRYREHVGTLDSLYYAKGKQRLEGLIRWTQGRANKLRDGTSLPPGLDEPVATGKDD